MSNTWKDQPRWVQLRNPHLPTVEHHDHRYHDCDLNDFDNATRNTQHDGTCHHDFADHRGTYRWWWPAHPPRWYVRHVWHAPQRTIIRDQLQEAAKEYSANGSLDDFDFVNIQARHGASWWWD